MERDGLKHLSKKERAAVSAYIAWLREKYEAEILGEDPVKHEGVVSLFGERIAQVGLADPKYGRTLRLMKRLGEKSDYDEKT